MSTDVHTLSGAYAINALHDNEVSDFEAHLAVCSVCRGEVTELQEAAALMGASEAMTPPVYLKARVLAAAERQRQDPPMVTSLADRRDRRAQRWTPRILASAAAVIMIVAAGIGFSQMQGDDDVQMAVEVTQVFEAADVQTKTIDTANGGTISIATSAERGEMAVDTDQLPELSVGEVYQLWEIRDGTSASAGVLEDPEAGAAMAMPDEGTQVAITIEPAGGSEQPTTDPIAVVTPTEL